jgi:hypothetical protein
MKIIACLTITAFVITGCSTLRPIQLSPEALQRNIESGYLVKPGDRVQVTTIDGNQHEFKVISIADGIIKGKDMEIPIKDISQVEKRTFSIGKTSGLVGGILAALYTTVLVAFIYGMSSMD